MLGTPMFTNTSSKNYREDNSASPYRRTTATEAAAAATISSTPTSSHAYYHSWSSPVGTAAPAAALGKPSNAPQLTTTGMTTTLTTRRRQPTTNNPFLRKPIPAPLEIYQEDVNNDNSNHQRRRPWQTAATAALQTAAAAVRTHPQPTRTPSTTTSKSTSYSAVQQQQPIPCAAVESTGAVTAIQSFEIDDSHQQQQLEHSNSLSPDTTSAQQGQVSALEDEHRLERHLTLLDLIAIGVGGTIGSGLFVLAGLVAHSYAGPSTVVSWAISGFASFLSGCCYAELAGRIPISGSSYAYTYIAMGELPALLAAVCLSLNYLVSASAVARSWGDKCVEWVEEELGNEHWINVVLGTHGVVSPLAFLMSCSIVALVLNGVQESKAATNAFTILKVAIVAMMVSVGLFHVQPSNWVPFFPPELGGFQGTLRGATGTFFGYIGYDQASCLAGEAIHPKRDLPRAILLTLVLVSLLYMLATLVLTGMQPYTDISPVSGFPMALYSVGSDWAGQLTAAGEIVTLPVVVLIGVVSQPRLLYAMAHDGLLPRYFGTLDAHGNLWNGAFVSGVILVLTATFVPFEHLNNVISCGVLTALSLSDTSLVLLWQEAPDEHDYSLATTATGRRTIVSLLPAPVASFLSSPYMLTAKLMGAFHVQAILTGWAVSRYWDSTAGKVVALTGCLMMIATMRAIAIWCTRASVFGGRHNNHPEQQQRHKQQHNEQQVQFQENGSDNNRGSLSSSTFIMKVEQAPESSQQLGTKNATTINNKDTDDTEDGYFRTPLLPYWPCLGIFVNWTLIAQLDSLSGMAGLFVLFGFAIAYYFWYARHTSVLNNNHHQQQNDGSVVVVVGDGMFRRQVSDDDDRAQRKAGLVVGLEENNDMDALKDSRHCDSRVSSTRSGALPAVVMSSKQQHSYSVARSHSASELEERSATYTNNNSQFAAIDHHSDHSS